MTGAPLAAGDRARPLGRACARRTPRATIALGAALATAFAAAPAAIAAETGFGTPGAALVLPYDATAGHVTFLAAQNTRSTQVSTHWTFWGEDCSRRADVEICLTPDDSVIVDPTVVASIGPDNEPLDDVMANLSGSRGFATVTAFAADDDCEPLRGSRTRILDDALTGSYSIAELERNSAYGSSAIVLHESGGEVELPDSPLLALDLYTWNPATLTKTQVVVIGLRENAGLRSGEVGPLGSGEDERVRASLRYVDTLEIATALPDVEIGCVLFADAQTLAAPAGAASSGFFRLSDFDPAVGDESAGSRTALFGLHGWAFHGFAQMQNAVYRFSEQ